jgi:hypothetical protein
MHCHIQYCNLSIFITVTYYTIAITTVLNNILFYRSLFFKCLLVYIFKLNCTLGMCEY